MMRLVSDTREAHLINSYSAVRRTKCRYLLNFLLFLLDAGKPGRQHHSHNRANTSVITSNELKSIREQLNNTTYNQSNVSVVTKSDLARIRTSTVIQSKEERIAEQKIENEQKMSRMAVAMARKQRMKQRDWERAENAPLEVKASTFGENTLLSKAQAQLDEQDDDVKFTNQMVQASKVFTIRDQQLEENK